MEKIKQLGITSFVCGSLLISCNRKMLTSKIKDVGGEVDNLANSSAHHRIVPQDLNNDNANKNEVYEGIKKIFYEKGEVIKHYLEEKVTKEQLDSFIDKLLEEGCQNNEKSESFFLQLFNEVMYQGYEKVPEIIEKLGTLIKEIGDFLRSKNDQQVTKCFFTSRALSEISDKYLNWIRNSRSSFSQYQTYSLHRRLTKMFKTFILYQPTLDTKIDTVNNKSFLRWCVKDTYLHANFFKIVTNKYKESMWDVSESEFESILLDILNMNFNYKTSKSNYDVFQPLMLELAEHKRITVNNNSEDQNCNLASVLIKAKKDSSLKDCSVHGDRVDQMMEIVDHVIKGNINKQIVKCRDSENKNNTLIHDIASQNGCVRENIGVLQSRNNVTWELLGVRNQDGLLPSDLGNSNSSIHNLTTQFFDGEKRAVHEEQRKQNSIAKALGMTNQTNQIEEGGVSSQENKATNQIETPLLNPVNSTSSQDHSIGTSIVPSPSPLHYFIAHLQSFGTGAVMQAGVLIVDNIFTALARRYDLSST